MECCIRLRNALAPRNYDGSVRRERSPMRAVAIDDSVCRKACNPARIRKLSDGLLSAIVDQVTSLD